MGRKGYVSACVLAWLLAACGGGGGGTPEPTSPVVLTPISQVPLALRTDKLSEVLVAGMGYGGTALSIAQLAIDWGAAIEAAGAPNLKTPCAARGTRTLKHIDSDGDRRMSSGDRLTVTLDDCYLQPLDDRFTGTLTIDFNRPGLGKQQAGQIVFGSRFGVVVDGVMVDLAGALQFDFSADQVSRALHVFSSAQAFAAKATIASMQIADEVTQLDARRELRRDTARSTTSMSYHLASGTLGGSLDVSTPTKWSAWFDSYPDIGELVVTGAGNQKAQMSVDKALGSQLLVMMDGQPAPSMYMSQLDAGALWTGADWGSSKGSNEVNYVTVPADMIGFKLATQPTPVELKAKPGPLVWSYTRPLVANALTSAKFVRTASGAGPSWGAHEVPADLRLDGAMVTVTAAAQLEPGDTYRLVFDNSYYGVWIYDGAGGRLGSPELTFTVPNTISASAVIDGGGVLLGTNASLTLDASKSNAAGAPVTSIQWRQISGPGLAWSNTNQVRTTVSPASTGNGNALIELEVRNAEGDIDRQQLNIRALGDLSQSFVVGYRSGPGPMTLYTNIDAGADNSFVRSYPANQALDIWIDEHLVNPYQVLRILTAVPAGMTWQTGVEFNYGATVGGSAALSLLRPETASCQAQTGHVKVLDFAIDAAGTVTRLALDFEHGCAGIDTLYGSVRFHSDVPLRL